MYRNGEEDMADIMKNMKKAEIVKLKEQVSYQEGQIISKTLDRKSTRLNSSHL